MDTTRFHAPDDRSSSAALWQETGAVGFDPSFNWLDEVMDAALAMRQVASVPLERIRLNPSWLRHEASQVRQRHWELFALHGDLLRDALNRLFSHVAPAATGGETAKEFEEETEAEEYEFAEYAETRAIAVSRLLPDLRNLETVVKAAALASRLTSDYKDTVDPEASHYAKGIARTLADKVPQTAQTVAYYTRHFENDPLVSVPLSEYEALQKKAKRLEQLEQMPFLFYEKLPDLPEYTPKIFAARHACGETNVRQHLRAWSERHHCFDKVTIGGRWVILHKNKEYAQRFDLWMRVNGRNMERKKTRKKAGKPKV